jgi:trehalose 6-phosphate phosphatase
MKHLFSPLGHQALVSVLAHKPLLAFDFDGTLAPIVAHADDARVSTEVALLLERLNAWRPVAIVTGRRVTDVATRLGFSPSYIIGNHGAEDAAMPNGSEFEFALSFARAQLCIHIDALIQSGVTIEDKGSSLALHYRLARNHQLAQKNISVALAGIGPEVHVFGGKCVVNIVAAAAPDKGVAVMRLVQRSISGAAVFVGDDVNDEAVFQLAPEHWLTVRVGRDDLNSAARFFLDSHVEVTLFLKKLAELMQLKR